MKKKISLLLAILMLVTVIPTAFAESKTVDAVKNTKKVTLDGEEVKVGAYDVEGFNYLKLRDVAAILNAKKCQFSVGYDEPTKLISVELAKAYEKVEGDLAEIKDEKAKAIVSVRKILVNGEEKEIKTALINEYNYMQLRDLGSLVGLDVKYDKVNKVIMLKSDAQVKEEKTDEKTEEKKEDKKEKNKDEKTDDKKDEKKEEKKDEAKGEAKVELVPEDKWTKEEKAWFDTCDNFHESAIASVSNNITDDSSEVEKIMNKHYSDLVFKSIYGGKVIFEGGAKSIDRRVEIRDGVRYCVAQYNYPSGSALKFEAYNVGSKDEDFNDYLVNSIILYQDKELPEKYQKDCKLICKAMIEFYDAIADKNYENAIKVANELGLKADEERVKSFENEMRRFAKAIDVEIFQKDYEAKEMPVPYNDEEKDSLVTFNYKDGSSFTLLFTNAFEGGIVGIINRASDK